MYKVTISETAFDDLASIENYISYKLKEPQSAARILNELKNMMQSLDSNPGRFVRVEHKRLAHLDLHKVAVKNYLILYRINVCTKKLRFTECFTGRAIGQNS